MDARELSPGLVERIVWASVETRSYHRAEVVLKKFGHAVPDNTAQRGTGDVGRALAIRRDAVATSDVAFATRPEKPPALAVAECDGSRMRWQPNAMAAECDGSRMRWRPNAMAAECDGGRMRWQSNAMAAECDGSRMRWQSNAMAAECDGSRMRWRSNAMAAECDGGRFRMREPGLGRGVHFSGEGWRETKNACLISATHRIFEQAPGPIRPRAFLTRNMW